ncbi:MAG: protein phosphatase CheZ [Sulfuricellaceae bacterium]
MKKKSQAETTAPVEGGTYEELGHLVRRLHETLRDLGCDDALQGVVGELPDTRDRLNYIATLTEQAANRALSAVEKAMPVQEALASEARELAELWRASAPAKGKEGEAQRRIQAFLDSMPERAGQVSEQLTEIMMAQDFQDLTGQVIKKVMTLAQEMENQLVNILLISKPAAEKTGDEGLLNGPVVKQEGRSDTVGNQQEVDDLLDSLGF